MFDTACRWCSKAVSTQGDENVTRSLGQGTPSREPPPVVRNGQSGHASASSRGPHDDAPNPEPQIPREGRAMRTYLSKGHRVILISLALICGLPALSTQAADFCLERAFLNSWEGSPPLATAHRQQLLRLRPLGWTTSRTHWTPTSKRTIPRPILPLP